MSRLTIPGLALLLALAAAVFADEPPKRAEPWSAAGVQDIIYLGEQRPILFRLHLNVDGKPFTERWHDYMTRLFKFLDRDDDGTLDKNEAKQMPNPLQMINLAQNINQIGSNFGQPPFTDVDANGDGKVTFDEFTAYYLRNGYGPVRLSGQAGLTNQATMLTELLFAILDTNKDGKLARAELEAAPRVLRKFDQDDDELITAAELQNSGLSTVAAPQGVPVQVIDPRTGVPMAAPAPFVLVEREEPGQRLLNRLKAAKEVLARYDRNKDGKLTMDELGFPQALFDKLGPNNGKVDATKLLRWLLALPDVELTFRLGKSEDRALPVEIVDTQRKELPSLPARKVANGTVAMTFGKTNLNLIRGDFPTGNQAANLAQFALQQFRQVDKDKKGYLTAKQLENPQFNFLKQIMNLADRDEDGKLTEKELLEFYEVMGGGMDAVMSLQFSDFGQGLFELLDTNRDGRLGTRELRNAWARLAEHDDNHDGAISKDELPRQCQLTISRGGSPFVPYAQLVQAQVRRSGMPGPGVTQPAAAGPLWFRKMDVNHDGDVSPREFLGSPEDFAKIDTDGDGLISLEEAIKADAWFRKRR